MCLYVCNALVYLLRPPNDACVKYLLQASCLSEILWGEKLYFVCVGLCNPFANL